MKASLTLVTDSEVSALSTEQPVNTAMVEALASPDRKAPHLKLVVPESSVGLVKTAIASKPARKPRKPKAAGTVAKKTTADKKIPAAKKPKKPSLRKKKTVDAPASESQAISAEAAAQLAQQFKVGQDIRTSLINAFIAAGASKTGDYASFLAVLDPQLLIATGLSQHTDATIPLLTDIVESSLQEQIDAGIVDFEHEASLAGEQAKGIELYAFNAIGRMFISEEKDPFLANEWVLFEEQVHSHWYESRKDAINGLHRLLIDAKLNFACVTKVVEKVFYIDDYAYKKYAFSAVIGLYFEEQTHSDLMLCREQCTQVNDHIVPAAKVAMRVCIDAHRDERERQLLPDTKVTDKALNWISAGLFATLAYALLVITIQSGVF